MTTAMQIGEIARDRADFRRCFKTGAAVFLHDDGVAAHSSYRDTLRAAYMLARTDSDMRLQALEHECHGCARPTFCLRLAVTAQKINAARRCRLDPGGRHCTEDQTDHTQSLRVFGVREFMGSNPRPPVFPCP